MVCNEAGRRIARATKPGKALTKLQEAERAIRRLIDRELLENQFSALASLIAGTSVSSFSRGRLRRLINEAHTESDWALVYEEFRHLWEKEESPSKQRRRKAEAKLFVTPSLIVHNTGMKDKIYP